MTPTSQKLASSRTRPSPQDLQLPALVAAARQLFDGNTKKIRAVEEAYRWLEGSTSRWEWELANVANKLEETPEPEKSTQELVVRILEMAYRCREKLEGYVSALDGKEGLWTVLIAVWENPFGLSNPSILSLDPSAIMLAEPDEEDNTQLGKEGERTNSKDLIEKWRGILNNPPRLHGSGCRIAKLLLNYLSGINNIEMDMVLSTNSKLKIDTLRKRVNTTTEDEISETAFYRVIANLRKEVEEKGTQTKGEQLMHPPNPRFSDGYEQQLKQLVQLTNTLRSEPDNKIRRTETGYCTVHLSRLASESVYHASHGVHGVAPRLNRNPIIFSDTCEALVQLARCVMADNINIDALAHLNDAIMAVGSPLEVGFSSVHASVALLGLNTIGGIYGAWQIQTLVWSAMPWEEHVEFNQHILKLVESLDPESAASDSKEYDLPGVQYMQAGCYYNIAKACWRAVVEGEATDRSKDDLLGIADEAMLNLLKLDEEQRQTVHFATLEAMQAAVGSQVGASRLYWAEKSASERKAIVKSVEATETSEALRKVVSDSAMFRE